MRQLLEGGLILALALAVVGCCGGGDSGARTAPPSPNQQGQAAPAEPATPPAAVTVKSASFGRKLGDHQQIVSPTTAFGLLDKVCLSVVLAGRPRKGVVGAQFMWRDKTLAQTNVDVSKVNEGLLFSFGQDTYVGFTFTPSKALWVGDQYHVDVTYDGRPLGSYNYKVLPPPGAIPTKLASAGTAKGATPDFQPIQPSTVFSQADMVHLVGKGDFGVQSWVQADWYVAGVLDKAGTRSLTLQENVQDTGFAFNFRPATGWPAGQHFVKLTIDDREVGQYSFVVQ